MGRTLDGLRTRLNQYCKDTKVCIETLLYCPDYTVKDIGSAGIDPSRIVDASRREHLPHIIQSILPLDVPASPITNQIHAFLSDTLNLVPSASAFVGQARTLYTRLSGGLTEWARKIEFEPFRLRVIGTAGSGKTQLAMSVFRDAILAGRRPLFVCYNRPLADHFKQTSPAGGVVAAYHQLCDMICRSAGKVPDFSQGGGVFKDMESFMTHFKPTDDELLSI